MNRSAFSRLLLLVVGLCAVGTLAPIRAWGFGFYAGSGLDLGARWDAAPRTISDGSTSWERSLAGGLRFSVQGGSYAAFRDLLTWQGSAPSVADFQQAVQNAFNFWTAVDPVSGLGSTLSFVADFSTTVDATVANFVRRGAEIDLFASTDGSFWNPGNSATQAEAFVNWIYPGAGGVSLTSGTAGYESYALSGADITFNSNPGAQYTLLTFQTILTHEIGHALGLRDVDVDAGPAGEFVDDNYSSANALATLTNSFAGLINPLDPSASPLSLFSVANGMPGFDTAGVDILMESSIPSALFSGASPLRNDDYAGRQFLYPVPEPSVAGLWCGAVMVMAAAGRWRRR